MSRLPESLDVVLNELHLRLHHAARAQDTPEVERYIMLIDLIVDELDETKETDE